MKEVRRIRLAANNLSVEAAVSSASKFIKDTNSFGELKSGLHPYPNTWKQFALGKKKSL